MSGENPRVCNQGILNYLLIKLRGDNNIFQFWNTVKSMIAQPELRNAVDRVQKGITNAFIRITCILTLFKFIFAKSIIVRIYIQDHQTCTSQAYMYCMIHCSEEIKTCDLYDHFFITALEHSLPCCYDNVIDHDYGECMFPLKTGTCT